MKANLTKFRGLRASFGRIVIALISAVGVVLTAAEQNYKFSTFAGVSAAPGSTDGVGTAARFKGPTAIATDASGTLYIADTENHTIRKMTTARLVTTLAGSPGQRGSVDGVGAAARFNRPGGIAVDGVGNVYVADTDNRTIRKITVEGLVSTLAGSAGLSGSLDGTGTLARFASPYGLTVDGTGSIYVSDMWNCTIRRVTTNGVVSTLAGSAGQSANVDGTGSAARFMAPYGLAIDRAGNIFVADWSSNTIRKITSNAVVTTLAGRANYPGWENGSAYEARFRQPCGIAVDSVGNVYVAEKLNQMIRRITPAGIVTTLAGAADEVGAVDGIGAAALFYDPIGLTIDSAGTLYVADTLNNTIRKVTAGGAVSTVAGVASRLPGADGTGDTARFFEPNGVAIDSAGNVYVADSWPSAIRKLTPNAGVTTLAGGPLRSINDVYVDGTGPNARFNLYYGGGIAVDGANTVFVAEAGNSTIRKVTAAGVVTTFAGTAGQFGSADGTGFAARFNFPTGVAVDAEGQLYVADRGNHVIRKINATGAVTTFAGKSGQPGASDGTGTDAGFYSPSGVATDSAGNVYVADTGNYTVRKITRAGVVTTVAGGTGQSGSADGTGTEARFGMPTGVAVDARNNIYIADARNNTIRRITPNGVVTTIGGIVRVAGSEDGAATDARFNYPVAIASDTAGVLYIADRSNNTIRKGSPAAAAIASRLVNLSIFTSLDATGDTFSMGYVVGGSGTRGTKPLVIRAAGPSLGALGVPATLDDPKLELFAGPNKIGENDNWGGSATLTSAMLAVGAFAYMGPTSRDAAATLSAEMGDNSVKVSANGGGTGSVIAEIYDATPSDGFNATTPRLVNVSIIKQLGTGLTVGFVVAGSGTKRVLVRAIGPTLSSAFGVIGALNDPQLSVYAGQIAVGSNDNWSGAAVLKSAFAAAGAFLLADSSRDAAAVLSLQPGSYTVVVTGVEKASGLVLVEVYELPEISGSP